MISVLLVCFGEAQNKKEWHSSGAGLIIERPLLCEDAQLLHAAEAMCAWGPLNADEWDALRRAVSPNITKKRKEGEAGCSARFNAGIHCESFAATEETAADRGGEEEQASDDDDDARTIFIGRRARQSSMGYGLNAERVEELEDDVLELQAEVARLTEQVRITLGLRAFKWNNPPTKWSPSDAWQSYHVAAVTAGTMHELC